MAIRLVLPRPRLALEGELQHWNQRCSPHPHSSPSLMARRLAHGNFLAPTVVIHCTILTNMKIAMTLVAMLAIWPFPSGKDFPMTADPSVPAAAGKVHVERDKDNRNTNLDIKVTHLARPSNLNPPATTYLVWIRPSGGDAVKQGAIGVDKNLNGELHAVTVLKNFDLFITAEQGETVTVPSSLEVLRTQVTLD
jgi:hypothetical protein